MAEDKAFQVDKERLAEEVSHAINQLSETAKEYAQDFCQAETDSGDVPLVFYVENIWQKMNDNTRDSLVHLVEGSIKSIDEQTLIESKKGNI